MALILCRECSKEISDEAPACPHCGVPNPEDSQVGSADALRPHEKFCHSCRAQILKAAEICPKCGVRQMRRPFLSGLFKRYS